MFRARWKPQVVIDGGTRAPRHPTLGSTRSEGLQRSSKKRKKKRREDEEEKKKKMKNNNNNNNKNKMYRGRGK